MSGVKQRWSTGNRFRLLENGEEFFPAVFGAIAAARKEVIIETFILFQDKVGLALHECLLAAARRVGEAERWLRQWLDAVRRRLADVEVFEQRDRA